MSNYQLVCCSTVDLPEEYLQKLDVPYILFHFLINGKEYDDDLGQSIPFDRFYQMIADGAMPTTSQPNVEEQKRFLEPFLKEGKDILYICFSSGLSGCYNAANVAIRELQLIYPERKIRLVDSLGASSGYGLLVDTLATMRDQGATLEEAYDWAEKNKLKLHHWFFSTDLTHYKRGGRISATSALFGTLLNICPLMNMNRRGELIPRRKVRTKRNVIREIVKEMETHAQNGLDYDQKCFISNSGCLEDAKQVAALIEEKFPKLNGKVMINSVGTVIGSHTGPGTVALFFFGDEREN